MIIIKIFSPGASLGVLSGPRFGIVGLVVANASIAISIAIRYSAVRRQFGPDGSPELPVIEYQMQQCRLFPLLAGCYVFKCFSRYLFDTLFEFILSQFNPDISAEERAVMGAELHGISAAAKPVAGYLLTCSSLINISSHDSYVCIFNYTLNCIGGWHEIRCKKAGNKFIECPLKTYW